MKIQRASQKDYIGTSGQGDIQCSYARLVNAFGKPHSMYWEKSDATWELVIDGLCCTIYDYKTGTNYLGKEGTPKEENIHWHIGGRDSECVSKVLAALEKYDETRKPLTYTPRFTDCPHCGQRIDN